MNDWKAILTREADNFVYALLALALVGIVMPLEPATGKAMAMALFGALVVKIKGGANGD